MDNEEMIKALRWCHTHGCSKCCALLDNGSCEYGGDVKIFESAADALEELQQIANHYEQTAKDYWEEAHEYKQRIAELEKSTKLPNRQDFLAKGSFIEEPLSIKEKTDAAN